MCFVVNVNLGLYTILPQGDIQHYNIYSTIQYLPPRNWVSWCHPKDKDFSMAHGDRRLTRVQSSELWITKFRAFTECLSNTISTFYWVQS